MILKINESYVNNVEGLKEEYYKGDPFPCIVLDNFLEGDIVKKIEASIHEAIDFIPWHFEGSFWAQVKKKWAQDPTTLPFAAGVALVFLNSSRTLDFLQKLTGLTDLVGDAEYNGGGVHCSSRGGSLAIHNDFNYHPRTRMHRRVNVLLYLNREWDDAWGGDLELWNKERTECIKKVKPVFNRAVIFNITDTAYHGFPHPLQCPEEEKRLSLATYYYTPDRPEEEKSPAHSSLFFKT
jgi:Rps23 Pro-64 3,4-dihydroxylase Tpa1-like proline 4-hydroxylase